MNTDTGAGEAAGATGDEEGSAPCVVVYLLEPGAGGERRTACLAMLRAATTLLASLPEHIRANVSVQVLCLSLPTPYYNEIFSLDNSQHLVDLH